MAKTVFGEQDAHLFREGTHTRLHDLLGAHLGDTSCYFSVWAPNAASVGVMGEFNDWRSERAPLELDESTGVWHGFVPGVARGSLYKYHVHSKLNDYRVDKSDPFATYREVPPQTASRGVAARLRMGRFGVDGLERANQRARRPVVHLRSSPRILETKH